MSKKKEMEDLENNSGNFVSNEEIRLLIESLTKPQLVDLLFQLGSKYPSIAEEIQSFANVDRAHQKLNVLDLDSNTNSTTLSSEFQAHAEIEEGNVMLDRDTGKSTQSALSAPSKLVDGVCVLDDEGNATDLSQRNLYIGNLSPEVTREMLLNYFERHGDIEECLIVYQCNKDSNVSSRSGFVTYKTGEAAKKAIDDLDQKTLGGRTITVKYDLNNGGGGQPSVPARVAPMAALHMSPEYVEGYTYPRPAAPYATPPNPFPQTGAPYAASPYPYSQTDAPPYPYPRIAAPPYPYPQTGAPYAAFPYPYSQTDAPTYPYPRIAVHPCPYSQTDAPPYPYPRIAVPLYPYPRIVVPLYPYPQTGAPYAAPPYPYPRTGAP